MDDTQLCRAWAAGDRSAGQTLCLRYFDQLYRFFRGKAPEDYEDLIQSTMLECVRSLKTYRGDAPFRAYLFGVARHRLLHHLRAKGTNRIDFKPSHSSIAELDPRPSALLAQQDDQRILFEALRRIPIDLQIALELHYWEELTTNELAKVLEIPQGTVKSRLRRGREALLAELNGHSGNRSRIRSSSGRVDSWIR